MPRSLFPGADEATRRRLERFDTIKRIDEYDWSQTELGPIANWPETLRGTIRVLSLASLPMVMFIGPRGRLVYNDAYLPIAGKRHPRSIGGAVADAWPEVGVLVDSVKDRVMAGDALSLANLEFICHRNDAPETVWLDVTFNPVQGDDGHAFAILATVSETTNRVMTEQELLRSEETLSLSIGSSHIVGVWDWDVPANRVSSDARFADLFGIGPEKARVGAPIGTFTKAIHPEDRDGVEMALATSLATGQDYRKEYRILDPEGQTRWVLASGRPIFGEDRVPVRFPGVVVDITSQKAAAMALAESEARFRTLANTMPQMVWSTRPDGYHDYFNARWYDFTGVAEGETDGEKWNEMFHPDDRQRTWATWRNSLKTGEPYQIEYRLRHHTGAYRWVLGRALPMRDDMGRIVRWIGTCTDIHEARLAAEEREVIAQELSHRIKNIFSVVTGIISLSARTYPELKDLSEDLRLRILALAQAHNYVRPQSRDAGAGASRRSMRALLETLLAAYNPTGFDRVTFSGDDARIDDSSATPLALLFHELATNAAKYGCFSKPNGSVEIVMFRDRDQLTIDWKERGGPPVGEPAALTGFGTRLITLSVEGQLRGTIERLWEPDGLRVRMVFPVAALMRSQATH